MIIIYKAKQSVILEDKFGVDHQFLKGHTYVIETDNTEKYIIAKGVNHITYIPKTSYFLTEEQVQKYFEIYKQEYITGGRGNPKTLFSNK